MRARRLSRSFGHTLAVVVLGSLATSGCGDDDGAIDGSAAFPPHIELGTSSDHFEPIVDGAILAMEHGPQGGQHIWISVRAHSLSIDPAYVRMTLTRISDGYSDGVSPTTVRVSVAPTREGYTDITGLRFFVTDRESLLAGDHEVSVKVTDSGRAAASATVRVRIVDSERASGEPVDAGTFVDGG